MANAVEKKDKPSFIKRVGNFFKRIGRFFKNMWHELKKVTWPTGMELAKYSLVVFVFMVIMGVIIGLMDFGSGALIDLIVNL